LFATADLFVLPSHADCLAMVLMEATAAGLPVVTTDVGALAEAVRDGESGLLIPPEDGRALQQALAKKFDARRNDGALFDLVMDVAQRRRQAGSAA
jgi:glycosyltransferase involved in cell wall biosynthesis